MKILAHCISPFKFLEGYTNRFYIEWFFIVIFSLSYVFSLGCGSPTQEDSDFCNGLTDAELTALGFYSIRVCIRDVSGHNLFFLEKLAEIRANISPQEKDSITVASTKSLLHNRAEGLSGHNIHLSFDFQTFFSPLDNAGSNYLLDIFSKAGYMAIKLPNDVLISENNANLLISYFTAPAGSTEASLQSIYDQGNEESIIDYANNFVFFQMDAKVDKSSSALAAIELLNPSGEQHYWAMITIQNAANESLPVVENGYLLNPKVRLQFDIAHNYDNTYELDMSYLLGVGKMTFGPVTALITLNDSRPSVFFLPDLSASASSSTSPLEYSNMVCNCSGADKNVSLSANVQPWDITAFDFYKDGNIINASNYLLSAANSCPDIWSFRCGGCSCETLTAKSVENAGVRDDTGILTFSVQGTQDSSLSATTQGTFIGSNSSVFPYLGATNDGSNISFNWKGLGGSVTYNYYYAPLDLSVISNASLGTSTDYVGPVSFFSPMFLMIESCDNGSCKFSNIISVP